MKKAIKILVFGLLFFPSISIAGDSEKNLKMEEAKGYIRTVLSEEINIRSSYENENSIDLEVYIDENGEIEIIDIDTKDKKVKKEIQTQVQDIVFPGIEEIHGKVIKCTLKLRKI